MNKRPNIHRRLIGTAIALSALIICLLGYRYHRYIYAFGWHSVHGSYAQVAGQKVSLPLLWWAEPDSAHYDTTLLIRASPANIGNPPEIIVSPALPGSVRDTDQEELRSVEGLVSSINQDPNVHDSASVVTIRAKHQTLYCSKQNISVAGFVVDSNLFCGTPGGKYFFSYHGTRASEKEAESILSTLGG